ncbi:MAG: carbohydrate ABC transporter permease [Planctomycetes bacterium]|nr:carbohydrate ABC transporter permease [Planctomycetota bacterium]
MSARLFNRSALAVAAVLFALPFAFLLVVSLAPEGRGLEDLSAGLVEPHPENYRLALEKMGGFGRLFANTLFVTVASIVGQCVTCSLAGYAFARIPFRGRDLLFACVLATMMLPEQVTAIPRFLLFREAGLVDTFGPLILPTVLGGAPFFVFLFRQYFLSLPIELDEAARLDGAGHLRIYWSIALPLARPMLATVAIFTFLGTWNDFWTPLIYLFSDENRTLTLALAGFQRSFNVAVEFMLAASAVVLAPCVLVYFVAQKVFLRGVRVAASKH